MTTRERKPAANQDPWTHQDTERDTGALVRFGLVATAIFAAGFVWFVGSTINSGSGWGRTLAFLLNAFAVVLLLGGMAGVVLVVAAGAKRTSRVVPKPDARYPMRYKDLDAVQAVAMVMQGLTQSRVLEAGRALPPGVQSVSQSQSSTLMNDLFGEEAPVALDPHALTTWAQLESAGELGNGRPPIIGWDMIEGELVRLDWEEGIGSFSIYGRPRSGKTMLGTVLAAQAVRDGGKLIVCDRHATDKQSLTMRLATFGFEDHFLIPPARTEHDIIAAFQSAVDILEQRMAGDPDRSLVLIFGEELTALFIKMRKEVEPLLNLIGAEGRKFGVNAFTFAQVPQKEYMGMFRDVAMSAACFRHDPKLGKMATGVVARELLNYAPGECCLMAANGDMYERIRVPEVTATDVAAIVPTAALPTPQRHLTAVGSEPKRVYTPEEELRIVDLFGLGKTTQEIVWEIRTRKPNGTRGYRELKEGVEEVLRLRLRDGSEEGS